MKPKYLELTPEDLAKVNRRRAQIESTKIDPEQLYIAEFGKHYGWAGVLAILNNEIDSETVSWLMQGARKIDYGHYYRYAEASFVGAGSAQAKKPSQTFKKATKDMVKHMQADL